MGKEGSTAKVAVGDRKFAVVLGMELNLVDNCVLRYLQAIAKDPNLCQMKDLSEQFQISSQGITTPHPCARDQHRKQPKKNENPMTLSSAQSPP